MWQTLKCLGTVVKKLGHVYSQRSPKPTKGCRANDDDDDDDDIYSQRL